MINHKGEHLRIQGQVMILVPVDPEAGHRTGREQAELAGYLQRRAASAGPAGKVVLAWQDSSGCSSFLGPQQWRAFLASIDLGFVWVNINRELTCS